MNSVSWFLYLSDVLGNLQVICILFAIGLLVVGFFCGLGGLVEDWKPGFSYALRCGLIALPLFLFGALVPSKSTFYAIAASEIGERAMQSEQVQGIASDATKALQQWIKRQIEPEKVK